MALIMYELGEGKITPWFWNVYKQFKKPSHYVCNERSRIRNHFRRVFINIFRDSKSAVIISKNILCPCELTAELRHFSNTLHLFGIRRHFCTPKFQKISDNKKCPPVWESKYKSKTIVLLIYNSVGFFIDSYWHDYPLWFIIWT